MVKIEASEENILQEVPVSENTLKTDETQPPDEIYLGVDPGLVNLGVSVYNKTQETFDIRQICLPVWKGRLHKLDKRHYYTVFKHKCETILSDILALPIKRIGIEHIYEFFRSQCPDLLFFTQVLYHCLKEYCSEVYWICPKKWRKATNTGDQKYADRKYNSWKSPIFENLQFIQRHFTVKNEKLEDGMEAALIAYVTAHHLEYVKINPTVPTQETPAPAPIVLLNKHPRHPEMIRYVTRNTGKLELRIPSRKRRSPAAAPKKEPKKTKVCKEESESSSDEETESEHEEKPRSLFA